MSDSDSIPVQMSVSGGEGIDRVVSSVDRLHLALTNLGQGSSGLSQLTSVMETMQRTMVSGFAELAKQSQSSNEAIRQGRQTSAEKLLQDQIKWEAKQHAQANKFHDKQIELEVKLENARANSLKRLMEAQDTAYNRQVADYAKFWEKILATQLAAEAKQKSIQEKRDTETHMSRVKEHAEYVRFWEQVVSTQEAAAQKQKAIQQHRDTEAHLQAQTAAQQIISITQKRDMELHELRQKATADAANAAERQRQLNTSFLTASPASQLRTAREAQVYGGLGGNVTNRFGSAAAGADIRALEEAHRKLHPVIDQTTKATQAHGHAMNEAHALARGLAGSLGGLWLTYGSVAPLLAGAAIASSLKNVVTVGKEVEQQLNFVSALGKEGVNLDQFLKITDSSLNSIVESSNAMRMLAQNGLSATQSLQVLPKLLDLAIVGEMSVGQAALAATGATSAFGLSMTEAGRVSDIFAKVAATSNTSVLAMTESMKQASTVASLFKVSIEETAGMLGLLAKINITGSAAGTSFTNMLTGLYEPTYKAKGILKELRVETDTASGGMKPFTLLLEDLKRSLVGMNDSARAELLGGIFTVRGLKSAELALSNIDEFKKKTEEARTAVGFMRGVVEQLEDSTSGAFKRTGVIVQNSLVKAFADASPYIQQFGQHLGRMLGSGEVQSGLSNLTVNLAKLSGVLLDNIEVVALSVAGYLGYRMLLPTIIPLFTAFTTATTAAAVAQGAATAASAAHVSAMRAGAATAATFTLAMETQTAATVATAAAQSAWMAFLLPALAALAIAVVAGTALWLLFRDGTSEVERTNVKLVNSLHVVTEALDKEIERLEKVNRLWDEKAGKYRLDKEAQSNFQEAEDEVSLIEAQMRAQGQNPAAARAAALVRPEMVMDSQGNMVLMTAHTTALADALIKADSVLKGFGEQLDRTNAKVLPEQAIEKTKQATQNLVSQMEQFAKQAGEIDSKNQLYQTNEEIRSVYRKTGQLITEALDPSKRLGDQVAEQARLEALAVSFRKYKDEANSLQSGRAGKPPSASDSLNARIAENALAKQLLDTERKTALVKAEADHKAGNLGELGFLEEKARLAKEAVAATVAQARANIGEVDGVKNKLAAEQKYRNQVQVGLEESKQINLRLAIDRQSVFDRMAKEERDLHAKTQTDKGQLVQAFLADYQATYGTVIQGINNDILESDDLTNTVRLNSYLAYLAKVREAGEQNAESKQLSEQFGSMLADVSAKMAELNAQSGPGAGLASSFNNASLALSAYQRALPDLIAKQRELQDIADKPGSSSAQQSAASNATKKLATEAQKMQGIWVNLGKTIEKSLGDAFGKGGAALGKLINANVAYANRRAQIEADYQADVAAGGEQATNASVKRAYDESSARVNSYAEMAGAAKGFFDESSDGYKLMEAAEKAFRAFELIETLRMFAVKSSTMMGLLGLKVATDQQAMASEGQYTLQSIAGSALRATADGIAAVAKAISSQPFPYNLIAGAATLAALAAIGVAISGSVSSSAMSSEDRQAQAGTGTVFGAGTRRDHEGKVILVGEKSESIKNSLEILQENSGLGLAHSSGMLDALRSIEYSLAGVTNSVIRTGIQGIDTERNAGRVESGFNSTFNAEGTLGKLSIGEIATKGFGSKLINRVLGGIFGGATEVVDFGVKGSSMSLADVSSGKLNMQQYADTKTDGGLFHRDRTATVDTALGADVNAQFTALVVGLGQGISAAADMLGIGGQAFRDRLNTFVVTIKEISVKGLTGEEIQAQFATAFSAMGDDMAQFAIAGLTPFAKAGEGYLETLARVANGLVQVRDVFAVLGKSLDMTGVNAVQVSEDLIKAAGGIENLTSGTKNFIDSFLTDEEKLVAVAASVTTRMAELNQSSVTTASAFKNLVMSQDLTTKGGQDMYAALIQVAPMFKAVTDAAEAAGRKTADQRKELQDELDELTMDSTQLRIKEGQAIEAANKDLFDAITLARKAKAEADERKTLQQQLDEMLLTTTQLRAKERLLIAEGNRDLFDRITLEMTAAETLTDAKSRLQEAYDAEKSAMEGVLGSLESFVTNLRKMRDSLKLGSLSPLTPAQKYDEARSQYEKIRAAAMAGDTDAQAGYEAATTAFLDASRVANASDAAYQADFTKVLSDAVAAEAWAKVQIDVQKASLAALEAQVAGLLEVKNAVLTVTAAVAALALAMGADGANVVAESQTAAITALYRSLLGRDPEAEGLAFWRAAMANGASVGELAAAIANSTEYRDRVVTQQGNSDMVTKLYDVLLDRLPDTSGKAFWENRLNEGASLGAVIEGMRGGLEYQGRGGSTDVLTEVYQILLNRLPDQPGLEYWQGRMNQGASLDAIIEGIRGGTEYRGLHPAAGGMNPASMNPATLNYAEMGTMNMLPLVEEIRRLNAQIAEMQEKQDEQTEAMVMATNQSNNAAAEKIVAATMAAAAMASSEPHRVPPT